MKHSSIHKHVWNTSISLRHNFTFFSLFSPLPPAVEREFLVRVDPNALVAADALDDEELDKVLHRLEKRVDHHCGARVEHLARVCEAPEVAAYRDAAVGALWKDKEVQGFMRRIG